MRSLALLLVPALLLAVASPAAAVAGNAVYATATGASLADFHYSGACNGPGTVTLVVHAPGGDQTLTAPVTSTAVGASCGAGLGCNGCPPVPEGFAWELKGAGVLLVGGGPSVYDTYTDQAVAFQMQGTFLGGALEAHGTFLH
jgi:hypothetical protein